VRISKVSLGEPATTVWGGGRREVIVTYDAFPNSQHNKQGYRPKFLKNGNSGRSKCREKHSDGVRPRTPEIMGKCFNYKARNGNRDGVDAGPRFTTYKRTSVSAARSEEGIRPVCRGNAVHPCCSFRLWGVGVKDIVSATGGCFVKTVQEINN